MRRFYFDMDGTIARFYENPGCLENHFSDGFFFELRPYENMLEAINMLSRRSDVHLGILSAVSHNSMADDKRRWVRKYLPNQAYLPVFISETGKSKAEYIQTLRDAPLTKDDVLIDDYSGNLESWEAAGGTAVKCINELNGRGWNGTNFSGNMLSCEDSPETIVDAIKRMLSLSDSPMLNRLGWTA